MRTPFIVGNWKMNLNKANAATLVQDIITGLHTSIHEVEVGLCPPFPYLERISKLLEGSPIVLGAQDGHWAEHGAYTGEVAMPMLVDVGCRYVIIGHSERRQHSGETDFIVAKKIAAALEAGLRVILCVGETEEQRDQGVMEDIVAGQLQGALVECFPDDMASIILAYEPIWAIGTGKTASSEQAQEVHEFLRAWLSRRFGDATAETVRIQYGGSVKPGNIRSLITMPDIDGALVGGASLTAEAFLQIVHQSAG